MGCEGKACPECKRRCLLIHSKKDRRLGTVTTFFKVMIGDEFSEVMFLPPLFTRTVSMLVDQKVDLVDALGQRWQTTLSNVRGSLAFQDGWRVFSVDHGLQVGDLLCFHYFKGSHFDVIIYKRTACELLNFPCDVSNCNKGKSICKDSVERNFSCHTIDKCSIDKQSSTISVSRSNIEITQSHFNFNDMENTPTSKQDTKNCENSFSRHQPVAHEGCIDELFCIPDRNLGYRGEDQSTLFDLSVFEMCNTKAGAGGNEEAPVDCGKLQDNTEAEFSVNGSAAEEAARVIPSKASNMITLEETNGSEENNMPLLKNDICNGTAYENYLHECVERSCNDRNTNLDVSKKKRRTSEILRDGHAGRQTIFYDEIGNLPAKNKNNEVRRIMKTEPVESPLPNAACFSCLVPTDGQSFLELPGCLPRAYNKQRLKQKRKVVVLKDPMMREWAVLYHESDEFRALGDGWGVFCKANGIHAGGECTFLLQTDPDTAPEDVYLVTIAPPAH